MGFAEDDTCRRCNGNGCAACKHLGFIKWHPPKYDPRFDPPRPAAIPLAMRCLIKELKKRGMM